VTKRSHVGEGGPAGIEVEGQRRRAVRRGLGGSGGPRHRVEVTGGSSSHSKGDV